LRANQQKIFNRVLFAGRAISDIERSKLVESELMMNTLVPTETRIMRLPAVAEKVGLSQSAIRARVKNRDFPPPVHIGERAIGFVADEVETWLVERMQCRCAQV
jgi:predicted DNA-binding transcriptional regulator AlpA